MKLFAARAEIDADDIILLYHQLGFTTVDEGLDLAEQAYPGRPIPARVKFLLTEIVDSMRTEIHHGWVLWAPARRNYVLNLRPSDATRSAGLRRADDAGDQVSCCGPISARPILAKLRQ